jgi:hypothetical protein
MKFSFAYKIISFAYWKISFAQKKFSFAYWKFSTALIILSWNYRKRRGGIWKIWEECTPII